MTCAMAQSRRVASPRISEVKKKKKASAGKSIISSANILSYEDFFSSFVKFLIGFV